MKIKLYELTQQFEEMLESIYLLNPEADQETVDHYLKDLGDVWSEKALSVAAYCKNIEAEVEAMKTYEKNMRSRRQVCENKLTRLKAYLLFHMERMGESKIIGDELTISLRKCPPSIDWEPGSTFDAEYTSTEIKPDRKKLKAAIEAGIKVPGVMLSQKNSLSIK